MSYFVGYKLEGEAETWHREVAEEISHRFGTWKVHEKVAPHLTIFYPFDTENIEHVSSVIASWTDKKKNLGTMLLDDFGKFDDVAIFAGLKTPAAVDTAVEELQNILLPILGTPRRGFRKWNPHATLAHRLSKETLREIWNYVQKLPKPRFELSFDNVTLFRYEGERKWSVEKVFRM